MDTEKKPFVIKSTQLGGRGTVRRKNVKSHKPKAVDDTKQLGSMVSKLKMANLPAADEANVFMNDGNVLHFNQPKVYASLQGKEQIVAVSGKGETKELTEMVPGILSQLGPESLNALRKLAEQYSKQQNSVRNPAEDDDDDEIPDLVGQTFDNSQD